MSGISTVSGTVSYGGIPVVSKLHRKNRCGHPGAGRNQKPATQRTRPMHITLDTQGGSVGFNSFKIDRRELI